MSKPRVLVLGGVGFIGRNFVTYLIENDLCDKVRVVDKVIPKTAFLNARQAAAFEKAEFLQKNLVNPSLFFLIHFISILFLLFFIIFIIGIKWELISNFKFPIAMIAQAFEDPDGKYDYVFNLAAETKYSQTEEVFFFLSFFLIETLE